MKKLTALFVVVFAVAFSSNIFAQNTATAEATASARVMTPISIEAVGNGLEFGTFASSNQAGTVTIAATSAGARTSDGGVTLSSVLGTSGSAEYTVEGEVNAMYDIDLPSQVTITSGSDQMIIDNFTTSATGTLTGGSQTIYVGATINVEAGQASGNYTGTYDVTVTYN